MQGIGNDFVMLDFISSPAPEDPFDLAVQVCDRRRGVGADGLILAEKGAGTEFRMRMFNPDGSESEMCGNGLRCFARYVHHLQPDLVSPLSVETGAGTLSVSIEPDKYVLTDMGRAKLTRGEIGMLGGPDETFIAQPIEEFRGTAVSMGNPHLVIFVDDVDAVDVRHTGRRLELHPLFPERVNVHFAEVKGERAIKQRTWERGAGETLACGTGACAVAVAAFLTGVAPREVDMELPGGSLHICYREDGHVTMKGPAEFVYEGEWPG